jgi:hypothetical protein
MIAHLPLLTPDAERGRRTIARCHQRLARRRARLRSADSGVNTTYLAIERALIGGLCAIYISSVFILALRMLSGG